MYQDQDNLDLLNKAVRVLVDRIALLDERTKRSTSIAYIIESSGRMAELANAVDRLFERQKTIKEHAAGK